MKITKIEAQKKDKHRYNIFIDGSFAFGLYEDSVLKYGLRSGDELNEKKIIEMREFDEFGYGKKAAYSFLAYKPRSKKDLVKKLKQKKISDNTIDDIIELLEKQKYLNDEIYARNYLEDKLSSKPIGKRLAMMKLLEKGIDKEQIESVINENYSEDKEFELAAKLMEKYEKKVKFKDQADKKNKCYRYLISKGFDYETAGRVLSLY
ncbi:MAG TPA: RecX family transcriptional regulator [Ignavibacteria bacterium]|nr:RecX family transcriptional regulator [Ignavibacteria bacterium]